MNIFKASPFKTWALLALIIGLIWSCDQKDDPSPAKSAVEGKWKLETISGGFSGSGYTANWNFLELKPDLSYRRMKNDSLRYQGTYVLQQKDGKTYIYFKASATPSSDAFENQDKEAIFEKEKLILRDPCCDLFQYDFSKAIN